MSIELDIQVITEVMGWKIYDVPFPHQGDHDWINDESNYPYIFRLDALLIKFTQPNRDGKSFSPSTDIAAAMQVVEKLAEEYYVTIGFDLGGASVSLERLDGESALDIEIVFADTVPEAICRVALMAVTGKELE